MKATPQPFATISVSFLFRAFFALTKLAFVLLFLVVGALVAGQSSVAPVSARLLTSYGMEYAVKTLKPYRHYFPEPFLINLEKQK